MQDLGKWELYVPEAPPEGAPPNTTFWRDAEGHDWYDFRARWLKRGDGERFEDTTGTIKVVVDDGVVITAATDASMLSTVTGHLYELEPGAAVPKLGEAFAP